MEGPSNLNMMRISLHLHPGWPVTPKAYSGGTFVLGLLVTLRLAYLLHSQPSPAALLVELGLECPRQTPNH